MSKCIHCSPRAVAYHYHITHGMHVPRFRQPHQNDKRRESNRQRKAGTPERPRPPKRRSTTGGRPDRQGENVLWLGADMGMDSDGHVAVKTVADPSPARRANMRSGDRVLSINKQPPPATQSERRNRKWMQAAIQTRRMVMHMERTAATRSSRPGKRPTRPQTSSPTKSPPRKKSMGTADQISQGAAAERIKQMVKDPSTGIGHHQMCPCHVLGVRHETIPNAEAMTKRCKGPCTQIGGTR